MEEIKFDECIYQKLYGEALPLEIQDELSGKEELTFRDLVAGSNEEKIWAMEIFNALVERGYGFHIDSLKAGSHLHPHKDIEGSILGGHENTVEYLCRLIGDLGEYLDTKNGKELINKANEIGRKNKNWTIPNVLLTSKSEKQSQPGVGIVHASTYPILEPGKNRSDSAQTI